MRALRDFNIPKIVTDDLPVFMGLIGDLFPALDVPRKRDPEFEKIIKGAVLHLRLQPEDSFVLKVSERTFYRGSYHNLRAVITVLHNAVVKVLEMAERSRMRRGLVFGVSA